MRLGLHIEVLFANFGFLAKPQPRVRYLNIFFDYLSRAWEYYWRETLYLRATDLYSSWCTVGYRLLETVCCTMLHPTHSSIVMICLHKGSWVFWKIKKKNRFVGYYRLRYFSQMRRITDTSVMSYQALGICFWYLSILEPFWYVNVHVILHPACAVEQKQMISVRYFNVKSKMVIYCGRTQCRKR